MTEQAQKKVTRPAARGLGYQNAKKPLLERWEVFDHCYTVDMRVATEFSIVNDGEPDSEMVGLDCIITVRTLALDDAPARTAGHFHAYLLGDYHGCSKFDMLDAHSQELSEFGALIDDDGISVSDRVREQFPSIAGNLLILRSAEIKPTYRGVGLGLLAARRVVELYGSDCIVAYKPFPLQFSGAADAPGFGDALRKLERYWARLGGEPIEAAPGLWGFSTDFPLIPVKEMLK